MHGTPMARTLSWPRWVEAVHDAAALIDLEAGVDQLQQAMTETRSKQIRKKLAKRIKVYQGFIKSKSRPEWMVLTVLPVIPPDFAPWFRWKVAALRHPT